MASHPTPLTGLCSNIHNQQRGTHLALITPGLVSKSCSPGSALRTGFLQTRASGLLSPTPHRLPASGLFPPATNRVPPHHCPCIPRSVQPTSRAHCSSLRQPQSTQKESMGKCADSAFLPGTCNRHLSLIARSIRSSRSSEYL